MDINVRIDEGCAPQPTLLWDAVWNPALGFADWAVAAPTEPLNVGGLRAMRPLDSAVILALFTDRACPPNHPLAPASGDLRGWWGDGVDVRTDLGEAPLGSLLWLLENSVLDPVATPRWAQALALDALQPIIAQGAAASAQAQAVLNASNPSRLDLAVQLYGRDGAQLYSTRFTDIWAKEFTPLPAGEFAVPVFPAPAAPPLNCFNDGGVLTLLDADGWPTAPGSSGALWSNGGVVCVTPGAAPSPGAAPMFYARFTAAALLAQGGADLPTGAPPKGSLQTWNNGGVVCIA